jgi:hypothetical protein
MPVYVDSRLAGEGIIEFNAGTHQSTGWRLYAPVECFQMGDHLFTAIASL